MKPTTSRWRTRAAATTILAAAIALGGLPASDAQTDPLAAVATSVVRVHTPTLAERDLLNSLGLDLTEHGGEDFVDVVLHTVADGDALRAAGLDFEVLVADLAARERERIAADEAFAAANPTTDLPSGRNAYRDLEDYNAEMEALAGSRPDLVSRFRLPEPSVEGRPVFGIEVAHRPGTDTGRPVMVMLGVHHAREWPSGESTMEFAHDLVNGYGTDARITRLLDTTRVLFVPVVNVDGFHASRTDAELLDLREQAEGDETAYTGVILANPGNAYKRKDCRIVDGLPTPQGACALPGNRYLGVDLNRNYGSLWGGNGAGALPADDTYRGPSPFSEPETRNIRALVSSHQVTMLITNHTFSNLVLRPPGVRDYGFNAEDEADMAHIGARMSAQNGYTNQHGWELYDTTGTTEDWSYLATGGFGYTFEIGPDEFHPPFEEVVAEYLGAGEFAGRGNREAFLIALEAAADPAYHSSLTGRAPAGAVLRIQRTADTETSPVQLLPTQFTDDPGLLTGPVQRLTDHVETTLVVPRNGRYDWRINPSTRPAAASRVLPADDESVVRTETYANTATATAPGESVDVPFTVAADEAGARLTADLDWATPDDYDLEVYRVGADGALTQVGSSGEPPGFKEQVILEGVAPGDFVLRVRNFAAVNPAWTLTTSLSVPGPSPIVEGTTEAWTVTCERFGIVRQSVQLVIGRGEAQRLDFRAC